MRETYRELASARAVLLDAMVRERAVLDRVVAEVRAVMPLIHALGLHPGPLEAALDEIGREATP